MLNRGNVSLLAASAILGGVALTLAAVDPPATSVNAGHTRVVALYGLVFSAALCFCTLVLATGFTLSPFSTLTRGTKAPAGRRTLPIAAGVVLLVVLWFSGSAVLKRILLSAAPGTFEAATSTGQHFLASFAQSERDRLNKIATAGAQASGVSTDPGADSALLLRALALGADAAWTLNPEGRVRWGLGLRGFTSKGISYAVETEPLAPDLVEMLPNALEVWEVDDKYFLAAGAALPKGRLVVARRVPPEWIGQWKQIEAAAGVAGQRDEFLARRAVRLNALLYLIVLFLLGGVAVSAHPWSQRAKAPSTEGEPRGD